jgi:hypothetical protein
MFSKLALFAVASLAAFVAALPNPGGSTVNQQACGNGETEQCCMSISLFIFHTSSLLIDC